MKIIKHITLPALLFLLVVSAVCSVREDGLYSHSVVALGHGCTLTLSHALGFWIDAGDFCMCFLLVVVCADRNPECWKSLSDALPPRWLTPLLLSLTGLWYYLQGQDRPCLTLIGSPNFGYRSVHRDLEAQIAIVTENEELQSQLQEVG